MSEKLREHPIIVYLAFILPALMLASAILLGANVFIFLAILAWIGVSIVVLFLPISDDTSTSQ